MKNIENQPVQSDQNDQELPNKFIKKHSDRLLSVDIVRGIAIFGILYSSYDLCDMVYRSNSFKLCTYVGSGYFRSNYFDGYLGGRRVSFFS